jgi:hypothetical protein
VRASLERAALRSAFITSLRLGRGGYGNVDLGAEIAANGNLDPRIIGEASSSGRYDPQALKKVWHCLARFGAPPLARSEAPSLVATCCFAEPGGQ